MEFGLDDPIVGRQTIGLTDESLDNKSYGLATRHTEYNKIAAECNRF